MKFPVIAAIIAALAIGTPIAMALSPLVVGFIGFVAIAIVLAFIALRLPKSPVSKTFVGMSVGHRGCRWISNSPQPHLAPPGTASTLPQIPENSMSSFKRAVEAGCTAIELDCRLTVDNHVVVMHDDIVSRVCTVASVNNKTYISDMTLKEVQTLRYKNWSDEGIPTLEEVLTWAKANKVKVFVELKSLTFSESKTLAEQVANIFLKLTAWEFACVIAFHPVAVYYIRYYQPKIETCILFCRDFFQWGVVNKAERVHWWSSLAWPMDIILLLVAPTLVPLFTGCQLVGPDAGILTRQDIDYYHNDLNVGIYCWVANTVQDHDFFLARGCSVGTDFIFPTRMDPLLVLNQMHRDNLTKEYAGVAQQYVK